jgi:hypothetical protein
MKLHLILPLFFLIFGCMKGKKVDLIIHNAIIHTANDMSEVEEAMAIKDGKIIEVGPERQILNKYRYDESIDMMQSSIYPPFTDGDFPLFSYLDSNKTNIHEQFSDIENELLEQGIDKIIIHNVTYSQLKLILSHIHQNPSVLKFIIFLKDEGKNFEYIKKKRNNNKHLYIQGLSINNLNDIENTIIRAKAHKLQIQIKESDYQSIESKIKNQLLEYSSDHRWVVNYKGSKFDAQLTRILLENLFIICSEKTKSTILQDNQLYSFGRGSIVNHSIFPSLNRFQKNNLLTNDNVLKSITNWSSYLTFSEKNEGTLEKNKLANFIVFPNEIDFSKNNKDLYISQLFHKGKEVYSTE